MLARSIIYAAVLAVCAPTARANTAIVDVYGVMGISVNNPLPTHATYSVASDFGTNFFDPNPATAYTPLTDITTIPGALAQITGAGYTVSASTTLSSNHAYASASSMSTNVLGTAGFSGWYDQVTINGGVGTGTASFTVKLSGTVDVGAIAGGIGYVLTTSNVHPSQLSSDALTFNMITNTPWALDSTTPIASYLIGASPYNDTDILFPTELAAPPGIPTIEDPSLLLGGEPIELVIPNFVLTPGEAQDVSATLHGTFNFTYGEVFYLISGLNTTLLNTAPFIEFGEFCISECPPPSSVDGTGATTLDFSNSANLVNIVLPQGATASFSSGETYNVTTVPEPAEWLMLLAGLGLVGWRARRRS